MVFTWSAVVVAYRARFDAQGRVEKGDLLIVAIAKYTRTSNTEFGN